MSDSAALPSEAVRNDRCNAGVAYARTLTGTARVTELVTVAVVGIIEHQRQVLAASRRLASGDRMQERSTRLIGSHLGIPGDLVDGSDMVQIIYGSASNARPVSTDSWLALAGAYRGHIRCSTPTSTPTSTAMSTGDNHNNAMVFAHDAILSPFRRLFIDASAHHPHSTAAAAAAATIEAPVTILDRNRYLHVYSGPHTGLAGPGAGEARALPLEAAPAGDNLDFQLDFLARVLYAESVGECFNGTVGTENDVVNTIPVHTDSNAAQLTKISAISVATAAGPQGVAAFKEAAEAAVEAAAAREATKAAEEAQRAALGLPAVVPLANTSAGSEGGAATRAAALAAATTVRVQDEIESLQSIARALTQRSEQEIRPHSLDSHSARVTQLTEAFAAMQIRDFALDLSEVTTAMKADIAAGVHGALAEAIAANALRKPRVGNRGRMASYEVEDAYLRRGFARNSSDLRFFRPLVAAGTPPSLNAMYGPRPHQTLKLFRPVARMSGPVMINLATNRSNQTRRATALVNGYDNGFAGEHAAIAADCAFASSVDSLAADPMPSSPPMIPRVTLPVSRRTVALGLGASGPERQVAAHRLRAQANPAHRPVSVAAAGAVYDIVVQVC